MIINDYNKLADYYDFLAHLVFGKSLLHAKLHFLRLIPAKAKICIIGGGTGRVLFELLKNDHHGHIVYLEKSSKMIALAKKGLDQRMSAQVHFVEGDESNLPKDKKYDAIITNFFLDQFTESRLSILMKSLNTHLEAQGLWLFTDFELKKGQPHYWWQFLLVKSMFAFFKVTVNIQTCKLPEFNLLFEKLNLEFSEEQYFFKKLLVSRVYKKEGSA